MRSRAVEKIWLAVSVFSMLSLILTLPVLVRANDRQVEEFHQTYSLAPSGQLSLENVNGDVHISGWDQNRVKVDAIKTVWSGTSLGDVKIEVDSRPDSIHIYSKYAHHWFGDSHWRVDYTVMVPSHASIDKIGLVNGRLDLGGIFGHVSASSVNGEIQLHGISGGADLSAVNGTINAAFNNPDVSQAVSLKTVNGSILLSLPSDTNANLSARTLNGRISCDFPMQINSGFVGHRLEGKLGKGGSGIRLNTVNGAITIRRAASEAN